MKIGIMQPYFFPYLGYFQMINYVDKWVVFDDVQYINHGWINRNRILHPKNEWQYIVVPLKKHSRQTLIKDIVINNNEKWKEKILGQLTQYKNKALYYNKVFKLVEKSLESNTDSITELNIKVLGAVCNYLKIDFKYDISSQCNFDYTNVSDSGEWALRISEQIGANEYINPCGGRELFNENKFRTSNIDLKFMKMQPILYNQNRKNFISNLSIIDIMMFNTVEEIKQMLRLYEVDRR